MTYKVMHFLIRFGGKIAWNKLDSTWVSLSVSPHS